MEDTLTHTNDVSQGGFSGEGLDDVPAPVEEEVFRCEEHDKTFKNKGGLRLHMTRAHGAERVSKQDRNKKRPRQRRQQQQPAAVTPVREFDAAKLLQQVSPNGHIATAHFERVHEFVEEGRKLHELLRG